MLKQPQAPTRPPFSLHLRVGAVVAVAAALALAAFLGAQEGATPGMLARAFEQANDQTGREMTVLPASKTEPRLPEIYRVIRPAGMGGEAPPIPPSETWPAS
ncbi:MAG: hypothetical protein ABI460_18595 [Caldimonas sp.]